VQDTGIRRARATAESADAQPRPGDSIFWLLGVAAVFTLAQLTPSLLRMPLGPDEITYIAQTSSHASSVMLPPVHGRAAALLAAPVTMLTTSLIAVRVWMAVLSGIGLFLALFAWRGIRPAWVLAMAGLVLASLSITQLSGVQIYPDWWTAVALLAMTGLFLQAVTGRMRGRLVIWLIGASAFFILLLRPQNLFFVLVPMIVAGVLVPAWRNRPVLIAIAVGAALGLAEWTAEAFALYGGLINRMSLAEQEPPKLALYHSLGYQLRTLSGPWYCLPGQCRHYLFPGVDAWWLALLAVLVLGVLVVRRTAAQASGFMAAATGIWVIGCFSLLVPFAAPRYFLPAFALLAINAADAIAWLVAPRRWRTVAVLGVCAFLLSGVITQRFVLRAEIRALDHERAGYISIATAMRAAGVRPPCVAASPSVAYFAGCGAPWTGMPISEYLRRVGGGLSSGSWWLIRVDGIRVWIRR
jgi:hypothetical protein